MTPLAPKKFDGTGRRQLSPQIKSRLWEYASLPLVTPALALTSSGESGKKRKNSAIHFKATNHRTRTDSLFPIKERKNATHQTYISRGSIWPDSTRKRGTYLETTYHHSSPENGTHTSDITYQISWILHLEKVFGITLI